MLKIGLTGNIGSGKSVVSRIFSQLRVPVYQADEESKKILQTEHVITEVTKHFGHDILTTGGQVDKKKLASVVFSDTHALQRLNSILHPRVRQDFQEWASKFSYLPYVVQEAAIIFESGFQNEFDYIVHVSCPQEIAIRRVMTRDGADRQTVLQRMRFQMEDIKKAALSDFVIRNDGSLLIIPQTLSIHRKLLETGTKNIP